MIILIFGFIFILFLIIYSKMKKLHYGNLTLITGGVKTGKTQLSVCLVEKQYKRQLREWRKKCRKSMKKFEKLPEKPLIYSNMPIGKKGMTYAPLTVDLITGKTRFRYGSVVYFNEASLIAGSKDIKDEDLNDYLLHFFKLCAHFTMGGYVFIDTQSPQDIHYTIKRSLSTYYDIYRRVTLPVVSLLWLRENKLVDGENTVAIDTNIDMQDGVFEGGKPLYFRLILNKWWKYYDRYAYVSLVSDKPVETTEILVQNQQISKMIRCRDLKKEMKKEAKK